MVGEGTTSDLMTAEQGAESEALASASLGFWASVPRPLSTTGALGEPFNLFTPWFSHLKMDIRKMLTS